MCLYMYVYFYVQENMFQYIRYVFFIVWKSVYSIQVKIMNVSMTLYIPMQAYICMPFLCFHVYVFLTTCVYCLFSIHIFLRMLVTTSIYINIYFNLFIPQDVSAYVPVQVYILYIPNYIYYIYQIVRKYLPVQLSILYVPTQVPVQVYIICTNIFIRVGTYMYESFSLFLYIYIYIYIYIFN